MYKRPSDNVVLQSSQKEIQKQENFPSFPAQALPLHLSPLPGVGDGCYVLHYVFTGLSFPSPAFTWGQKHHGDQTDEKSKTNHRTEDLNSTPAVPGGFEFLKQSLCALGTFSKHSHNPAWLLLLLG